jgi:arsenate reductase (thioredoxin)
MKFSFGSKSKTKQNQTILFVCVENAGRSQMAESFFRKHAPQGFEPISAGTKPTSQVNPIVVQAMDEVGISISKQKPKDITEDMMRNSTKIVNMGCMDKSFCPTVFIHS